MRIFTIESGRVTPGVSLNKFKLAGAGVEIDAVLVGETGRGRNLGVLPVSGVGPWMPDVPESRPVVPYADLAETKAGKPKLVARDIAGSERDIIVVCRTPIGFRGGNSHTGDRSGASLKCPHTVQGPEYSDSASPCPGPIIDGKCSNPEHYLRPELEFLPLPGRIICEGTIAQGDAGRAGSGQQIVAIVPMDAVFRTGYSGRLYGAPGAHYYKWDGERLLAATWEERQVSDVF
jgi:hypothetical protein